MIRLSHCIFFVAAVIACYSCTTSTNTDTASSKANFDKLIFQSSRCNGSCPQISLQVDSSRIIFVDRVFYISKGEIDSARSGRFKGVLNEAQFAKLLEVLDSSDYTHLQFPDILCCDKVITTIIVYSKGQRTYLKSMNPPEEAKALVAFLYQLGTELKLEKTTDEFSIEE